MDVVKTAARSGTPTGAAPAGVIGAAERRSRTDVIRRLLTDGPSTAARLATALGLSGTAVRRHLEALVDEGAVTSREAATVGRRGRGRPARVYLLTDVGRARLPHAYDDLATEALQYLAEQAGPEAVTDFARRRAQTVVDTVRGDLSSAESVTDRTRILADALTGSGYAASVERVGVGEQLCQHHCPVAHVAARFPQLCEEELAVFTSALGTYAQRLATIARGDSFCTTFIPTAPPEGPAQPVRPGTVAGRTPTDPGVVPAGDVTQPLGRTTR
jgi:predicted ArsR family transcriptional regulator